MKLSIVIPNFNGSRTLFKVVKSVVEQLPEDSEVAVVDDHSTDKSTDLIKGKFPRVLVYENRCNLGSAASRNKGIKQTKGEWILFVDADVTLEPNCISSLLSISKTADIIFPRIFYPNGEIMYPVDERQALYLMISPIFLIRRAALNAIVEPCFDEVYGTYCEDTDFFLRTYLAGLVSSFQVDARAIHNVKLLPGNRESRYYLEMRNSIYGAIKFLGMKNGINRFDHAFKLGNIIKLLVCGFFNFNPFDMQSRGYGKYGNFKYNFGILFKGKNPITNRGSPFLIILSVKALLWNLAHLSQTLIARDRLFKQVKKYSGYT
jgi:GT2 family glycosyltransferase